MIEIKIKIGILGYGNLGKGVESSIKSNLDMELVGIFTRRDPKSLEIMTEGVDIYSMDDIVWMKENIDIMIICGGSATDLPTMTPNMAKHFNVIDSFDNHKKIPEHFKNVDIGAKEGNNIALISVGWDPGMFSLNRVYANAILNNGTDYTFWGKGVSQGHSQAIKRIEGVLDAKQYTIPIDSALRAVRSGGNPELPNGERHIRECFVVAEEGANIVRIEEEIKTMPNYFANYNTIVNFISKEELEKEHGGIPHGGFVIRSGKTGWNDENTQIIEYSLKLDSNPEFNACVLLAYARAAYRMRKKGITGCKTVFDVAPRDLSPMNSEELRALML